MAQILEAFGVDMDQVAGLWDSISITWEGFQNWSPPHRLMPLVAVVSMIAAFLLTRALGGAKIFTGPISFIFLFFLAMFANYLGRELHFPGVTEHQKFIAFAIAGQVFGAVFLLFAFKVGEGGKA